MTAPAHALRINVSIAHHDPYVATGIAALLRSSTDFTLQSEGSEDVDVLVTDYSTGTLKAASSTPRRRAGKVASLLIVSEQDRGWQIRRAVDAGVRGYLLQDCSANELADAVRTVAQGHRYLSRSAADRVLDTLVQSVPTAREFEVLQHMACGLGNKNIGRLLGNQLERPDAHGLEAEGDQHRVLAADIVGYPAEKRPGDAVQDAVNRQG